MKKATFVCLLVVCGGGVFARAQDADDYSTSFGGESSDAVDTSSRAAGPRDIAEAKKQGRAYRLGSAAGTPTPAGGKDVHIVQEGDTLWDISNHYFGDPWHWPELWSYNPEITNPHWIYPLDQVRLTPDQTTAKLVPAPNAEKAGTQTLSGTETAPSVVVPRSAWKPGMVFLRDQGYLDDEALRKSGQIVGGNEEQMLLSPSDQVYVRFKNDEDVQAGQSYTVFRTMRKAERGEKEKGTLIKILGLVMIRSYDRDKHVARGIVTEAMDPIERGLFVAKLDRRFDLVAPKRNEANVVAHIVASVQPRTLLSFGNVVFLDVGEGHGIEPGNVFFVVRRGDTWLSSLHAKPMDLGAIGEIPEYNPSELPKEVMAELRVLKVRKTTTIALITRSDTDLAIGDMAEMRAGF